MNQSNPMKLYVWNDAADVFNYQQLASNFTSIASHDHSDGKGVKIGAGGISDSAIQPRHISDGAVVIGKLGAGAVQSSNIGTGQVKTDNIGSGQVGLYHLDSEVTDKLIIPSTVNNLPPSSSAKIGDEVYIVGGQKGEVWHLRYSGTSVDSSGTWQFIGGTPAATYQNTNFEVGLTMDTFDPDVYEDVSAGYLPYLKIPPGAYQITFNAFLDFKYISHPNAEFRLYLFNNKTKLADTVLAPPLGETTQLALPVSRTVQISNKSTLSLNFKVSTVKAQAPPGPNWSYVKRASIVATPLYLYGN